MPNRHQAYTRRACLRPFRFFADSRIGRNGEGVDQHVGAIESHLWQNIVESAEGWGGAFL